jgi:hypothetical protein
MKAVALPSASRKGSCRAVEAAAGKFAQNETPKAPPEFEKTLWFANALPNANDSNIM